MRLTHKSCCFGGAGEGAGVGFAGVGCAGVGFAGVGLGAGAGVGLIGAGGNQHCPDVQHKEGRKANELEDKTKDCGGATDLDQTESRLLSSHEHKRAEQC